MYWHKNIYDIYIKKIVLRFIIRSWKKLWSSIDWKREKEKERNDRRRKKIYKKKGSDKERQTYISIGRVERGYKEKER